MDAGFGAFVSKPFEERDLLREIELARPRASGTESPAKPLPEAPGGGCACSFDEDRFTSLLRLMDADGAGSASLIEDHRAQLEQGLSTMRAALRHGDNRTVTAEAHSLRGSVLTFGGEGLAEALLRLEQRDCPLDPALIEEFERLATSYMGHITGDGCAQDRDRERT